jgi:hypothetical protein
MFGATTGLEKEANVSGTPAAYTLVNFGGDDNTVAPAADGSKVIPGVLQFAPTTDQPQGRIRMSGISWVRVGAAAVTRGDPITSDANGNGITAAPAAGANAYIVGYAMASGVAGQLIPVLVLPQRIQG